MSEHNAYAVYFFPQALESLGDAIKPYLHEGPGGACVQCKAIDTGGSLIEMTLSTKNPDGNWVDIELMVPSGMVRMIVSTVNDDAFGFGARVSTPAIAATHAAALPTQTTENED